MPLGTEIRRVHTMQYSSIIFYAVIFFDTLDDYIEYYLFSQNIDLNKIFSYLNIGISKLKERQIILLLFIFHTSWKTFPMNILMTFVVIVFEFIQMISQL